MRNVLRRLDVVLFVGLMAGLGALGLKAATQGASGFAPEDACVSNARVLALAVTEYEQDNDELLPPTKTAQAFQKALMPFARDPAVFVCPADGKAFVPNPAISGKVVTQFSDPGAVETFRDVPSEGGQATIAYLDEHIERGNVEQGDPNQIIYSRARQLANAVGGYAANNDRHLPPTHSISEFQTALMPFIHGHRAFYSLNGKPFVPNPYVSGLSLSQIKDPSHTVVFQDQTPHVGGSSTFGYADLHAAHGKFGQGPRLDGNNVRNLLFAVQQYTFDNDEHLPPTDNYQAFQAALAPYASDASLFVSPDNGLPYLLNKSISGQSRQNFPDPASVELLRDPQLGRFGILNVANLVYVDQQFYYLPKDVTVDYNDQTRLFWRSVDSRASVWTLSPDGTVLSETPYTLDQAGADEFSVGGDGGVRLLWGRSFHTGPAGLPITGAITLETLGGNGGLISALRYGPYDGWTVPFLATGPDNESRLLWRRYDGTYALWTVSPDGVYEGDVRYQPNPSLTPVGLARGKDGLTRLLWKTTTGAATLWTLTPDGQMQSTVSFRPHRGFAVTALALGPDDRPRLLWDSSTQSEVWTLGTDGTYQNYVTFTPASGYVPQSLGVGRQGDLRVLATRADGYARLQTLNANGVQTGNVDLTPYQ